MVSIMATVMVFIGFTASAKASDMVTATFSANVTVTVTMGNIGFGFRHGYLWMRAEAR